MSASRASRAAHFRRRVWAIAWREFTAIVLTKGFIFGVLVLPAMMFVMFAVVPILLHEGPRAVSGQVLIADSTGLVAPASQRALESLLASHDSDRSGADAALGDSGLSEDATPERVSVTFLQTEASESELSRKLGEGQCLAYAIVPEALLSAAPPDDVSMTLAVASWTSPDNTSLFGRAIRQGVVRARLERAGHDFESTRILMAQPTERTIRLTDDGTSAPEDAKSRMLIPMGFMMLMWMVVFTGANQLLTSTIEEKSSKIMEVLLSAASPFELLAGKVLGQGLVSLLMLVIYGGLGVSSLIAFTMGDLVTPFNLLLLAAYGLTAYLMIASIMAAVGSAVNDLKEAQSLVGPVMMVLMVPLILWLPIIDNPNGMVATITSFLPPFTPFVMILRATGTVEPIPAWQIPATLALSAAACVGFLWIGSRVFRVGVLMQGKTPTPRELIKWAWVR